MKKMMQALGLFILVWLSSHTTQTASAVMVKDTKGETEVYATTSQVEKLVVTEATETVEKTEVISPVVYEPNYYPVGQCTWGAKELAPWAGTYWGNANDWAESARAAGFEVGDTPRVGAIMVWSDGGYGHVAVVTEVGENGQIQVMEANYAGNQAVGNYRGWFNAADEAIYATVSYIYAPVGATN